MRLIEAQEIVNPLNIRILTFCGEGAFGDVFLAEDTIGRHVAVKIVNKRKLGNSWEREFRGIQHYCQQSVSHPNLISIFHVHDCKDYFCYTMEAANNIIPESDGKSYAPDTLEVRLTLNGRLGYEDVIHYSEILAEALEAIHRMGLVHRDIKPGNILFVGEQIKIGDMGLVSTAGAPLSVAGTPGFMPPEIYQSDSNSFSNDPSQDIYSLGKVMYCMFTGNPPTRFPLLPIALPRNRKNQLLNTFILHTCANNPNERFIHIKDFKKSFQKMVSQINQNYALFCIKWTFLAFFPALCLGALGYIAYMHWINPSIIAPSRPNKSHDITAENLRFAPIISSIPDATLAAKFIFYKQLPPNIRAIAVPMTSKGFTFTEKGISLPKYKKDTQRELFLDLAQTPLKDDFEIVISGEGNIGKMGVHFYFYDINENPQGLVNKEVTKKGIISFHNTMIENRSQWSTVNIEGVLDTQNSNAEVEDNPHRFFRQQHRIRREGNKVSYYSNNRRIFEFERSEYFSKHSDLRFAVHFFSKERGELNISQILLYEQPPKTEE